MARFIAMGFAICDCALWANPIVDVDFVGAVAGAKFAPAFILSRIKNNVKTADKIFVEIYLLFQKSMI
jgi:hypothetical protein